VVTNPLLVAAESYNWKPVPSGYARLVTAGSSAPNADGITASINANAARRMKTLRHLLLVIKTLTP
jgi:hypothetical protein